MGNLTVNNLEGLLIKTASEKSEAVFFGEPPGSLTHPVHCPKYQYVMYHHPLEGVRFGY